MEPNVLLIILDSVRASNTSVHGYTHDTTPFLRSFAADATVFEQARSPGVRSLTSHTSIFTGLHVAEHGITEYEDKLAPGHTIWEELQEEEYETGVFTENHFVTHESFGLSNVFEHVERGGRYKVPFPEAVDPIKYSEESVANYLAFLRDGVVCGRPVRSVLNGATLKFDLDDWLPNRWTEHMNRPAGIYADLFSEWVTERSGPWAACINFMDAHNPYLPQSEHLLSDSGGLFDLQDDISDMTWEIICGCRPTWQVNALQGLYDGTIHQIDAAIEQTIATLKQQGEYDDTLIVITADHGEAFGDQSHLRPDTPISGHAVGIHESLLHVPLVVKWPGSERGERIDDVASLTHFPDAVRAARRGDDGPAEAFCPDGPVIASKETLTEVMAKRGQDYCEDISRFEGKERAVYENDGERVVKNVVAEYGNGEAATTRTLSEGAGLAYRDGTGDRHRVQETFDVLEDVGVRVGTDGVDELNDAVQEQLEHWGYL